MKTKMQKILIPVLIVSIATVNIYAKSGLTAEKAIPISQENVTLSTDRNVNAEKNVQSTPTVVVVAATYVATMAALAYLGVTAANAARPAPPIAPATEPLSPEGYFSSYDEYEHVMLAKLDYHN